MEVKRARHVMIPLVDVPTVGEADTLVDAAAALDLASQPAADGRLPFRVALVVDDRGRVVGKLGHLAFLQALEPGYESPGEREALRRAGVDPTLIDSISSHRRFWESDLELLCDRAARLRVGEVMRPVGESVEDSTPLVEACSVLVRSGMLSVLVRHGDLVVGLLRLADIYRVVATMISGASGAVREEVK